MKLVVTEDLNRTLSSVSTLVNLNETELDVEHKWIDHAAALKVAKAASVPLHQLLQGSGAYVAQPQPAPKTEEYKKLMAKLREEAAATDYEKLVGGKKEENPKMRISREVNDQLTAVINILISIAAVTWAFWYWCSSWEPGLRVLMSLFGGAVTAVAEVVVFARYWRHKAEKAVKAATDPIELAEKSLALDSGNTDEKYVIRADTSIKENETLSFSVKDEASLTNPNVRQRLGRDNTTEKYPVDLKKQ